MEQKEENWWKEETIDDLRASIDRLDKSLMQILSERLRCFAKWSALSGDQLEKPDVKNQFSYLMTDENLGQPFFPSLDFWESFYGYIFNLQDEIADKMKGRELPGLYLLEKRFNLIDELENLEMILVKTMVERFRIVWRVGQYKKNMEQQPLAPERWQQILDDKINQANELGLPSEMIVDMFNVIHKEALSMQEKIRLAAQKNK